MGNVKSFTLTIPNLAKLVKIFPGIIVRRHHRSETNGIADRAVRRVKEGTAVLLQSGLNESWWADSMECYTYLRNVTDLSSDGKTPVWETFWATILKDRIFHLVHWLSITLQLRRTSQESINLERKVLPGWFLGYALYAGEFGRVTYWLQTLRSWRRWTHRKSTQKKDSMRKRWYFPKKRRIYFPIADGRIKFLGGDHDLRTSTSIRHRPIQGESHIDFLWES